MLNLIKSGSGSYHQAKLRAALEMLNTKSNLIPKPIVIPVIPAGTRTQQNENHTKYANAPDKIIEIRFTQIYGIHRLAAVRNGKTPRQPRVTLEYCTIYK